MPDVLSSNGYGKTTLVEDCQVGHGGHGDGPCGPPTAAILGHKDRPHGPAVMR